MRQGFLATLALAAAVLMAPHAWAAALDGALLTTCSGFSDSGGMTECPVDLVKGQDYDFHARGDQGGSAILELVNPVGQVTISIWSPDDSNVSSEFRAAYTGTFRIRVRPDCEGCEYDQTVDLFTDCRADAKTLCRLPLGGTATVVQ